jgi:regulator of replication initiation timing
VNLIDEKDSAIGVTLKQLEEENMMLKSEAATLKTLVDKATRENLSLTSTVTKLQERIKELQSNDGSKVVVDEALSSFKLTDEP